MQLVGTQKTESNLVFLMLIAFYIFYSFKWANLSRELIATKGKKIEVIQFEVASTDKS